MTVTLLPIVPLVLWLILVARGIPAWRTLAGTTLTSAVVWMQFANVVLCLSALGSLMRWPNDAWRDQLWYFSAILVAVPPVAVLGARKPGAAAWTWFVLVPMVLVLEWPAVSGFRSDGPPARMILEGPQAIGYFVVLTMGYGNYFGTRFTTATLLAAAAAVLLMLPHLGVGFLAPTTSRTLAAVCHVFAVLSVRPEPRSNQVESERERWDRLWRTFRDWFGAVWAKRVMDRINESSQGERWSLRLDLDGFKTVETTTDQLTEAETLTRIDHWMRVLLRRFVTTEWIDRCMAEAHRAARE